MEPLRLGIVGTGNIAGQYASDSRSYPALRLVAATDLDAARAAAFAELHECRAVGSVDALVDDPEVDIVVNLTVHHAHGGTRHPRRSSTSASSSTSGSTR